MFHFWQLDPDYVGNIMLIKNPTNKYQSSFVRFGEAFFGDFWWKKSSDDLKQTQDLVWSVVCRQFSFRAFSRWFRGCSRKLSQKSRQKEKTDWAVDLLNLLKVLMYSRCHDSHDVMFLESDDPAISSAQQILAPCDPKGPDAAGFLRRFQTAILEVRKTHHIGIFKKCVP